MEAPRTTRRLRVLHATHDLQPLDPEDAGTYAAELRRVLASGHHITVLCTDPDPAHAYGQITWHLSGGLPVVGIGMANGGYKRSSDADPARLISSRLEHVLQIVQPDVVQVHDPLKVPFGLQAVARARGIPVVASLDADVVGTPHDESLAAPLAHGTAGRRVAAVVLNFRTPADTAVAVASLMASDRGPDDIIVVDNGAEAECRTALSGWNGAVSYLPAARNLGFSGGMNIGIREALNRGADLVLLVNSDVVVPPDCLGRLEAALLATPGVAIAGPLVMSRSFPDVVSSAGVDYNPKTGRMRHRAAGVPLDRWRDSTRREVDAVSGCLMLVSREVFDRVGLFDERYFFSFEEIELCLRARAAGLRTRMVGDAFAYHEGARTMGPQSPRRLYFATRNHLLMATTIGRGDHAVARGARAAWIIALNVAYAVRTNGGSVTERVGASLRGVRDHLTGSYGPDV